MNLQTSINVLDNGIRDLTEHLPATVRDATRLLLGQHLKVLVDALNEKVKPAPAEQVAEQISAPNEDTNP